MKTGIRDKHPGSATLKFSHADWRITSGPVVAWLAVMQEGLLNLTQLNSALCHTHLAR
jgi:hypothetical protein